MIFSIQTWGASRYISLTPTSTICAELQLSQMHIWCLSQCLIQLGHKVIIITHSYENRKGIRYMTNGLKVYYLPLLAFYDQVIFPTLYAFFPIFRNILIRENITIIHGHQSTSSLTNECILYARTMGYHVCYTDHSLFGFADAARFVSIRSKCGNVLYYFPKYPYQ